MSTTEIWVDIPGEWLRNYQVSNLGMIRATDYYRPKIGRPFPPGLIATKEDIDGYRRVGLTSNVKKRIFYKVSRLVAFSFCINDDPINKVHVDHVDGDCINDNFQNLEWVTEAENQRRRVDRMKASGKCHSKFVGVTWVSRDKLWLSQIVPAPKARRVNIGYFKSEEDAARAYDAYVIKNRLPHRTNTAYWEAELDR